MTYPYGLVADVHAHSWSQFASINAHGVNSRLAIILGELMRAAKAVKAAGGDTLVIAGDLFHVRGKIEPSVFNPTFDCIKHIAQDLDVSVHIIPGNHDLESSNSSKLGNAMQQLELIDRVYVAVDVGYTDHSIMIPWHENLDELRAVLKKYADPKLDCIIHAPVDGVIKGLPDQGLTPSELSQLGYRRVFAGHYHFHRAFPDGVYSIGATTHQTWSDPATLAGFCLVYPDRVEHHETNAPLFVNIDDVTDIDAINVAGNYARLRLKDAEPDELAKAREALKDCGALGWVDHSSKKREVSRGQSSTKNVTLEVSIVEYVDKHLQAGKLSKKQIALDALEVLKEAQTLGDD